MHRMVGGKTMHNPEYGCTIAGFGKMPETRCFETTSCRFAESNRTRTCVCVRQAGEKAAVPPLCRFLFIELYWVL